MPEEMHSSQPETVKTAFRLPFREGFLEASVRVPAGRTTLTALLPVLQNVENALTARLAEQAAEAGSPVSCRAGCAACCRQMVPISVFEAEALTDWMNTLSAPQRAEIERRFRRALTQLRDAGVIDAIRANEDVTERMRYVELGIKYLKAGVACPFLEDENCTIYPIRPLVCREHMVTTSPEFCGKPDAGEVIGVDLPVKLTNVLFQFGREIEKNPRGWMPLVFLLAWARSDAKPGEYVAGTGEEVLGKILEMAARIVEHERQFDDAARRESAG